MTGAPSSSTESSAETTESVEEPLARPEFKRLNVNLPTAVFDEFQNLALRSGRSMTDLVRIALGLAKIGIEETGKGRRLAVTNEDGDLLKEILLPR